MKMDEQQKNVGVPLSAFISYAHEDELLCQKLETHLSLLRRQGLLETWYDRQITPGTEWAEEIDEHLEKAQLVLLLISPDFLASDYCYGIEMKRALERHKNANAMVIPVILRPVDLEGAPFANLQCLPRDAKAVTEWDNQDAAFRDIARGVRTAIEQFSSPQPVPPASRTPAIESTQAPTDRNRQSMLKRVYTTWISGVLNQSLHGAALMVLGLEEKADVLDNPWRLLMQEVDRPSQQLPDGTRIIEVYNSNEGGLLILGEPGAGKTTMLLELTRDLLSRAQTNDNLPIPVVFNLSSWAKKRLALENWLIEELSIRYEVPRRLGQSWVSEDRLMLLLDGLDEVVSSERKGCIEAINNYRQTHPNVQIVVCSRITEYLNQPTQLRLRTAVVIQPLTQEQIDTYLEGAGEQEKVLREALHQDSDLRELATTPLMLTILLFAYRGTSPDKISMQTSLEAKREEIFASYVHHMLKRRGASERYQPEQITHWLSYLAQQMRRQRQTVFYIEQLQPDWLPKVGARTFYRVIAGGVSGGLLFGLVGVVVGTIISSIIASYTIISVLYTPILWSVITAGLVIGLIIGQILGSLIGLFRPKSTAINPIEVITLSWTNARQAAIASIIGGPIGVLILYHTAASITNLLNRIFYAYGHIPDILYEPFAIVASILYLLTLLLILIGPECICYILMHLYTYRNPNGHRAFISKQRIWYAARRGALIGIFMVCIGITLLLLTIIVTRTLVEFTGMRIDLYLVIIACVSGLLIGLVFGVSHRQLETHSSMNRNQGMLRSLFNGVRITLIVGLIVSLAYDVGVIVLFTRAIGRVSPTEHIYFPTQQLLTGVIVGLSIGLFFGLLNGGIACINHGLLRVFLWRRKVSPWNYARFLDYAVDRILLRRVGGGYIFIHRLLLEYFAAFATSVPEKVPVRMVSDGQPVLSSTSQVENTPLQEYTSPPAPRRMTGFNKEKRIAALCVALLLLEFSLTPIFISMVQQDAQNTGYASATAQTQAYQAASTSTALAWATANASLIAANPNPYSSGTLALYDSLSHSLDWYNYTDTSFGGTCQFTKGAFHVIQSRPQRFYYCTEYRDFSNFTFEVQMTIAQGDCGGIVFRVEPGVQLYYFGICQNGHYYLTLHVDNTAIHIRHLKGKFTSAIKTGLHVSNVIAVVAKGSQLSLFVNKQNIANVTDSTYSHGTLGLSADDDNHPTDVIFQNAKLWQS